MGRFSNLEFDGEEKREQRPAEPGRDGRYWLDQATAQLHDGRFENALRLYSRALEGDVRLPQAWLGQVQALLEMDEPNEARVWADKGLESFQRDSELLAAKGVASARLGDLDRGMALSDQAMAEPGETPWRWRARGEVMLARGDRKEDLCFDKAVAAAGRDWWEPLACGRAYLRHGKAGAALRHFETASERTAKSAFLWEEMGRCLLELGMDERAEKAYRAAVELEPARETAKAGLARARMGKGSRFWRWLFRG